MTKKALSEKMDYLVDYVKRQIQESAESAEKNCDPEYRSSYQVGFLKGTLNNIILELEIMKSNI